MVEQLLDTVAMSIDFPSALTALNPSFPVLLSADRDSICWSLRPAEAEETPDHFFHWQVSYFEVAQTF